MTLLGPPESSRETAFERIHIADEDEAEYGIARAHIRAQMSTADAVTIRPYPGSIPSVDTMAALETATAKAAARMYYRYRFRESFPYIRAARQLEYASKGGKVDVQSAHLADPTRPNLLKATWRSFIDGLGHTFAIAPVRRRVDTPQEALRRAARDLTRVIEGSKERG